MDRPGWTDLFVALKANGVRSVIVESATRLARDLRISEIILGEFRKLGVRVISADGGIDLTFGQAVAPHPSTTGNPASFTHREVEVLKMEACGGSRFVPVGLGGSGVQTSHVRNILQ